MTRKLCMALLCLILTNCCRAQQFYFPKIQTDDSVAIAEQMPVFANQVLLKYKSHDDQKSQLNHLFRLQTLAGKYADAKVTIASLRSLSNTNDPYANLLYKQHELFSDAKQEQTSNNTAFKTVFAQLFRNFVKGLDDKSAYRSYTAFMTRGGIDDLKNNFQNTLSEEQKKDSLDITGAITLCENYYLWQLYQNIEAISKPLIKEDCNRRYSIQDTLIKTKDGAHIAAIIVLKREPTTPQPVVLQYTIYADSSDWTRIVEPAAYGYNGVIAYTRGKAFSPDKIIPYEHDGKDANDVIDWISKQSWSNGKIGMYGGSYNGFTQWAAAKYANPALKTIVPYVAAIPGLGLPMENNVFINANYGWAFYITGNKYLDNKTYNDPKRWQAINDNWYASGVAYRKIDSVDGTLNPLLQRWLKHPDYDKYWQDQVPYKNDFAGINIPVLTFEGYYDDGQISGLHYLIEHLKYNPKANHYLIIGPYDHFGTQSGGAPILRDYKVDPVALISTRDITFQWLDYILKGTEKPGILKNKVNYEVMGANVWKHAPSINKMANKTLKLYLTNIKEGDNYHLSEKKPVKPGVLNQTIDLTDRKTSNGDYYPFPIIKEQIDRSNGLYFISKPFYRPVSVNGMFSGRLKATINKKDMDIYVVLYEVTPDGKYFELSYFLGRASYSGDMSKRVLLHPGKTEDIPFSRTRLVSRQLSKGSRLLVVLNIDKNNFAQVNYGSGKDVSDETIRDGKIPLKIKWHNDSYINVPVMQ
jgi:putative CocE/NonD family hydrolase